MATPTPPPQDVKDYGDKKQEAQDAEALAATAAMEAETTPNVQLPEAEAAAQQPQAEQAAPQGAAPAPAQRPGVQPRNLMQIVPSSLLFRDRNQKTNASRAYDVGQLWNVLAGAYGAPPAIQAIARRLMGEE